MPDDRTVGLLKRRLGSRRKNSVTPHGLCQERFPSSDDFTYPLQAAGWLATRLDSSPTPKLNLGGKNDPQRVCFVSVNLQNQVRLRGPTVAWRGLRPPGSKMTGNGLHMQKTHRESPEPQSVAVDGRAAAPVRYGENGASQGQKRINSWETARHTALSH